MPSLKIRPYDQRSSRGDLHAMVAGDALLLPSAIAAAVAQQGVRTAEDLLSYLHSFPTAVEKLLEWQSGDVAKATDLLHQQLQGHVDPLHLRQPDQPNPSLGARPPPSKP